MNDGQRLFDAGVRLMLTTRQGLSARLGELSLPQFRVLSALERCPGCSLAEQARMHDVTPPAMSKIIDGLVTRGLVSRDQDAADRRINRHGLTPAGRDVVLEGRRHVADLLQARLASLDRHDRTAIAAALPALQRLAEVDA